MKFKWIFWTLVIAAIVFFSVVYFGIKYNWVNQAAPKYPTSDSVKQTDTTGTLPLGVPTIENDGQATTTAPNSGNGVKPELLDEEPVAIDSQILGSASLNIEQIVDQCHSIATNVGIPAEQFDQAVLECIERNSNHLNDDAPEALSEREVLIREQCDLAITQKELLSEEEVKMLVDECVASMQ